MFQFRAPILSSIEITLWPTPKQQLAHILQPPPHYKGEEILQHTKETGDKMMWLEKRYKLRTKKRIRRVRETRPILILGICVHRPTLSCCLGNITKFIYTEVGGGDEKTNMHN
jgi:hypothetical protein